MRRQETRTLPCMVASWWPRVFPMHTCSHTYAPARAWPTSFHAPYMHVHYTHLCTVRTCMHVSHVHAKHAHMGSLSIARTCQHTNRVTERLVIEAQSTMKDKLIRRQGTLHSKRTAASPVATSSCATIPSYLLSSAYSMAGTYIQQALVGVGEHS